MSKYLTFYVQFHLKPEHMDEFKERLVYVLESMSVEETFVDCYMHQDADDPTRLSVYERWTEPSAEAFMKNQLHAKEYRREYEERIPELLASPRVITFLDPEEEWVNEKVKPSASDLAFYVDFQVKPDRVDDWKREARAVIDKMAHEETFVACYMHRDAEDENRFTLYERWREPSREAFMENQLKGKTYRDEYEKTLPDMLESPRVITFLDSLMARVR